MTDEENIIMYPWTWPEMNERLKELKELKKIREKTNGLLSEKEFDEYMKELESKQTDNN